MASLPASTHHGQAPALAERYCSVRAASERIARPLSAEDCVVQSMPDASPIKWHLAHTSWFFETLVLADADPGRRPFDPSFRTLFNSYYNSVGDKHPRPERGLLTRPPLARVLEYRSHVDDAMQTLMARRELAPEVAARIELGLNHEQQHQELMLTDLKHLLGCNPLAPSYRDDLKQASSSPSASPSVPAPASVPAWIPIEGGLVEVGHQGDAFAFDNEGPRHRHWIAPFLLADRPVTNAEYQAFVDDGGYGRHELWLSDGWDLVHSARWGSPLYWQRRDGGWAEFTLGGLRTLVPGAPVTHLSYYEADAYARWADARLPTEVEWEVAAALAGSHSGGLAGSGSGPDGNLMDSDLLHPAPAPSSGRTRLRQLYGDVWEWTASAYLPYPGFRPAAGALGEYNGKFMSNQMVLRGGSCATPRDHIRVTYRNFFQPDKRWQFTGIRLARDRA